MKAITNGKIVTPNGIIEDKVLIFNERIHDISNEIPQNVQIIDAHGLYVCPGLIDVHIHGYHNIETMDTGSRLDEMSRYLAQNGVTAFLPTTMTMAKDDIYQALDNIADYMKHPLPGASILGTHLEGPFVNGTYKGAQTETYILKPDFSFIKPYQDIIKIITYAPEMDDHFIFTKKILKDTNIVLSIGHSAATYATVKEVLAYGVDHFTHLFNAMLPLNHREPGVVGAGLNSSSYVECIADMIHVNKEIYQIILKCKEKKEIVLITDCMRAGGMPEGTYDLGGQLATVKNGAVRLKNGTLAGSILKLNQAVRNFYQNTTLTFDEAIHLASLNPARSIKMDKQKGSLQIGKDADIALFDENMNCFGTFVMGQIVYKLFYAGTSF